MIGKTITFNISLAGTLLLFVLDKHGRIYFFVVFWVAEAVKSL